MNALIAYGTKWGSTEAVAEKIADQVRQQGHAAEVLDLRLPHDVRLEDHDLVVIGSGIAYGAWSKGAQRFLEQNSASLAGKRLALFACCGDLMFDPLREEEYRKRYLADVADNYCLSPFAMGLFGGVLDFNQYGFLVRGILTMRNAGKKDMEERGIDPSKPYDFRDWEQIKKWSRDLVEVR